MTARTDIERLLDVWLQDGPTTIADPVIDRALDTVDRTPQVSVWRAGWRTHSMSMLARVAAVAVIAVVATSALAYLSSRPASVGGQAPPVATPIPSPSAALEASPSAAPSGAGSPSPSSLTAVRDGLQILDVGSTMSAGIRYVPRDFTPDVSFVGQAGWLLRAQVDQPREGPDHVFIDGRNGVAFLGIVRPSQAITEGGAAVIAVPTDLVAWLQ
ncbi:MAG TPA: hypothetical protein VEG29_00825, partial [Candidatus Binatia bacterium]|nr:hypothetical protein [Candidatus Binatia bacterium]